MEEYMRRLGLVMNASELGVTPDMLVGIADSTLIMTGGYKILNREDVIAIVKESMNQ